MTKNIINAAMVLLGAGSLLTGCDFEQPEAGCFVQDSASWAAKYDVVEPPSGENCTDAHAAPPAERLGVFKFVDPDNLDKPTIVIRPQGLASLGARDTTNDPSVQQTIGNLANEPNAEDFCVATDFPPARVQADATATAAATDITYEFSNVRMYAAPRALGQQLAAELRYTKDGCTSTYVVRAIWQAAAYPCDPDEPVGSPDNCGANVNPEFAVVCEPTVGMCVPSGPIPSLVSEG